MREVQLLPAAAGDIADGQFFYERQAPELGQHFRATLNADLRSLMIHGGVHRKVYGFHRCLSKRFPYGIYYRVDNEIVLIYAVLDCRRDPDGLRARLLGR